ncbi:hypothetical protein B0H14DRAFT_3489429 [Mycena olivaceomarginata]|nr:hypothetical protein B0H14DRAFT_3489429 [Mycena olivaceomarginata]
MNRRGRPRAKNLVDDVHTEEFQFDSCLVADRGIYVALNGRSRQEELLSVVQKRRQLEPTNLIDPLAAWVPVPDTQTDMEEEEVPSVDPPVGLGKRKEYVSTRDPASLWRPMKAFFLDELLRHESLGDDLEHPRCALCLAAFVTDDAATPRLFKCYDCGVHLQCEGCCLSQHARTPLHVVQEWSGSHWTTCTLESLGLIYQLGHGGFPCGFPDETIRILTVIEAPTIHQIRVHYCKCAKSDQADNLEQLLQNSWYPATVTDPKTCATFRSLEAYRLYNVVGNLNVRDFVTAMERTMDTTACSGMTWLPDRYKQFQRMARQWAFLKRIKRAGRGHDPAGVDKTKLGECAVACWACPHDGRNLPDNWRDVAPEYRFLYMLILAIDANFRMKNRMRANEIHDPPLGPGWGFWVEPEGYKTHLKNYVQEKDVSSCIAFAALLQKDTRLTTGLHVSGVGGVVCAQHECMRANGLGDLQKGERYSNMDYIVMSALIGFTLLWLTLSYDIACQWKMHLPEQMKKLPDAMQLPLDDIKLQCALPVWHASSHNGDCKDVNSLSFKEGVGKSDGEGDALRHKLVVALAERDKQIKNLNVVSSAVEGDVKRVWKKMIQQWIEDPSAPNPYTLNWKDCPSEADVRAELRRDEAALGAAGRTPLHGSSATAFLSAGIQIEDSQRRILAELEGTALVAADRDNNIQEWRHTLLAKITRFRTLQTIYMPDAPQAIKDAEAARDADAPPPKPENISSGCLMEGRLRVAQCDNSLVGLRSRLHAKRFLIDDRNENATGQVASTKARTLIAQLGERVEALAKRYRKGRAALDTLKGAEAHPHLRVLAREDVRLDGDVGESDAAARRRLAMIGAGRGARAPRNAPGTSRRVMSWIWTAPGAFDDEEVHLHDSIRVEWCRAHARKTRWCEEVMLLREEMRRVLRYLDWEAGVVARAGGAEDRCFAEVAAGVRAYALKRAGWNGRLAGYFRTLWNVSADVAAQQEQAPEGLANLFE